MTRAPLAEVRYLLDYDLLVVKPTLTGGLLFSHRPHAALPQAASKLARQLFDFRGASMTPKVLIVPAERGHLAWRTPRTVPPEEAELKHVLRNDAAIYDYYQLVDPFLDDDIFGCLGYPGTIRSGR